MAGGGCFVQPGSGGHGRQTVESAHPYCDSGWIGLQVDKLVLPPSVTIRSVTPLPVVVQGGEAPLAIEGPVSVKSIAGAVTVNADARVSGVEGQVSVTAEDPLAVRADVSVDKTITIGGKVDIEGKVKPTLLPVPGL